ncbi:MAG: ubiquinone biosynthesis protein [Acidimicrobiales bacterium]|jgi:ubiquinone biosynthesis protein
MATDDLHVGAFSDHPPWSVADLDATWLRRVPSLRREQARLLPRLTKPPWFPPVARAFTVIRILGVAVAIWAVTARGKSHSRADISRRVRESAEKLGTTYIKLAQIISAGEGVFPRELVDECKKCRDQVPAEPYQTVVSVVEAELGRPMHEIFRSFEPTPLAAASIAQVHAAVLRTGESVVVKVQRPGIDDLVKRDLRVLAWLAQFLVGRIPVSALANPPALVELFAETIVEELDFRVEAANMLDVAKMMVDLDQRGFVIPRPHPEHVTQRILVMERLSGFKFDDVAGMKDAGVDTHAVIKTGMLGFLEGAFLHGIFHGDLHGGNLFVMADGRTALLDFGITGRLSQKERLAFLRMMMTATTNDVTGQVEALRDLGALPEDTDIEAVIKDLGLDGPPLDPTQLDPDQLVKELQRVIKALLGYGARMPKSLMLYVKNLIFIDGAIASLAPELDMFAVVTEIGTHFATTHGAAIAVQLGLPAESWDVDLDGVKAGFGVDPATTDRLTYAELQERRALIHKRLTGRKVD